MKSLIEFIYNGEVNIYQDNLPELLRIANILKIKGLDDMPSQMTTQSAHTNENVDDNANTGGNSFIKIQKDKNVASTSDRATTSKSSKKRKSVSFSDTPQIVCDSNNASSSMLTEQHSDGGGGGGESSSAKRKLRSLPDICSITKIKNESDETSSTMANRNDGDGDDGDDNDDSSEEANKDQRLVVRINPHAIYSSNESINDTDNDGASPKKPQQHQQRTSSMSRKMIRKNENFLRALEAVRDEGIGFCKAAKIHGVNNRTLWLEYQKRGYPMKNARKKSQ